MVDSHVVSALKAKRGEIAGRIHHGQHELKRLIAELDHIDGALRIFDPDIDLDAIKVKPVAYQHHAFKGELSKVVLDALRTASEPMTTPELAEIVLRARSLDPGERGLMHTMVKRVGSCLRMQRRNGNVREDGKRGGLGLWRVAGPHHP